LNKRLSFGVNIYNLFNSDAITSVDQTFDATLLPDGTWSPDNPSTTAIETSNGWGLPTALVNPRFVRFTLSMQF
jgi:outer membrane receptor protein involved in Fe transport